MMGSGKQENVQLIFTGLILFNSAISTSSIQNDIFNYYEKTTETSEENLYATTVFTLTIISVVFNLV